MFETRIWIDIEKEEKLVREAVEGIKKKDPTFKYRIEKNFLIIESENRNQAFKRGAWLLNKVKVLALHGYNVIFVKN